MRENSNIYLFLLLIYLVLAGLALLLINYFDIGLEFMEISIMLTGALIISFISSFIFLRGLNQDRSRNVLSTLLAIVLKFLLFIVLIGLFAIISEDLSISFLIAFFIIYLSFTLYLLITFVRILKYRNEFKPDGKGEAV